MRARKRVAFFALCLAACAGLAALGAWQLQRRVWKLDLIARVDARVHAAPVAMPARAEWPALDANAIEYRRVRIDGHFLNDKTTRVDALTERGPGVWVLTPMLTPTATVLVNRGFEPREHVPDESQPSGELTVVGLLRLSEPGGRFLRPNRPADDIWYSRDVASIAATRGLHDVAPFFIDAEQAPTLAGAYPIGGMTIVQFRNMHAVYALTWFALAALAGFGAWRVATGRIESTNGSAASATSLQDGQSRSGPR